jgi:hypothetical protein
VTTGGLWWTVVDVAVDVDVARRGHVDEGVLYVDTGANDVDVVTLTWTWY